MSTLTTNEIPIVNRNDDVVSYKLRTIHENIKNAINDNQAQISALTTTPGGTEVTNARDYFTVLRDRIRAGSANHTSVVLSGGAVTINGVDPQKVDITAGSALVSASDSKSVGVEWSASTSGTIAFTSANTRYDVVAVNSSGTLVVVTGSESANPVLPAIAVTQKPLWVLLIGTASVALGWDAREQGAKYSDGGHYKWKFAIQDAIDDIASGDIYIGRGQYYEEVDLSGKSNISLIGENGSKLYRANDTSRCIKSINSGGSETTGISIYNLKLYGNSKAGSVPNIEISYTDRFYLKNTYSDGNSGSSATGKDLELDNCDYFQIFSSDFASRSITNISRASVILDNVYHFGTGVATGAYSFAEGTGGTASGASSHAEGHNNTASGDYSHAEGSGCTASVASSHSEGYLTAASGVASHAEGQSTTASGATSHAEGSDSLASGDSSHCEGYNCEASGESSHAEGNTTIANQPASHAEGYDTTASGNYAHAEGTGTTASGASSHAEGNASLASGASSHAEGISTTASGDYSHAEGNTTTASVASSHSEGLETAASAPAAHAEGQNTIASGQASHSEGYYTEANGDYSHAEGNDSNANGESSHAEGNGCFAQGESSHAEGTETIASGVYSHAEGAACEAVGNASHASGLQSNTRLTGQYSHSTGNFAGVGDCQYTRYILKGTTTDTSAHELTSPERFSVLDEHAYGYTATILARQDTGADHAMFKRMGIIQRTGGTVSEVGAEQTIGTDINPGSFGGVTIAADNTNKTINVSVTGLGSHNVRWMCILDVAEIGYAD